MTPAAAAAALHPALCACCGGDRYVLEHDVPRVCAVCGGDGLAKRHAAAVADAARLSVDWLT